MSRPLRITYPGALYHITSRGNERKRIFRTDDDRQRFLSVLEKTVHRYHWRCYAYCLMDNHYHLLIETTQANLSIGMRQINGVYTQSFNRAHKRVGHLFQGRFKAILVQKETHLLELCRYVVLNPIRAKMCAKPEEYVWSSYRATAGMAKRPFFLESDYILNQFGSRNNYRKFVMDFKARSPWKDLKGQIYCGDDEFAEKNSKGTIKKGQFQEIANEQINPVRPSLLKIFLDFKDVENINAIGAAYSKYGYTMKQIADYLGVHYATISRKIKKYECKT
jgi:putative transposase